MERHFAVLAVGALLVLTLVTGAAGVPAVDVSKSSIIVTFRQENVPVDAPFKKFNGRIDYDPEHPGAAKAAIEITTGSLDLGSEEYSAEVRKKNWLDATTYRTAT